MLKVMTESDGIEVLYAARLKTYGYKMYAPVKDIVFHNYDAHQFQHKFKVKRDSNQLKMDQIRMNQLLSLNHTTDSKNDQFGMGDKMSLKRYYEIAGVNIMKRTTKCLCDYLRKQQWNS